VGGAVGTGVDVANPNNETLSPATSVGVAAVEDCSPASLAAAVALGVTLEVKALVAAGASAAVIGRVAETVVVRVAPGVAAGTVAVGAGV
jgi:hypothetical protein